MQYANAGTGATDASAEGGGGGFVRTGLDVLGKIWNAPNTAIGLLYAGVGRLFGGDFSIGNNGIQLENSPLQRSGYAVTLGNVIVYGGGQATPQAYGPHESQHTIQGQVLGPLYLPANLIGMGASLISAPFTGVSPRGILFGPANFMEAGPYSTPPRPWP